MNKTCVLLLIFLFLNFPLKAEVVNEEECLKSLALDGKEGNFLMKRIKYQHEIDKEVCFSRIFCGNTGSKSTNRFDITVYHACYPKGKPEESGNSYFDFGNSLFSLSEGRHGLHSEINSVSIQGLKVYVAGYGYDENKKLVSRVSVSKPYIRIDNRDSDSDYSIVIQDREGGVFQFETHDGKDKLYFYKYIPCTNKTFELKLIKGCFAKELISYPAP